MSDDTTIFYKDTDGTIIPEWKYRYALTWWLEFSDEKKQELIDEFDEGKSLDEVLKSISTIKRIYEWVKYNAEIDNLIKVLQDSRRGGYTIERQDKNSGANRWDEAYPLDWLIDKYYFRSRPND